MVGLRAPVLRLLVAALLGFVLALLVPRQRWRSRRRELPSGPWPPLDGIEPATGPGDALSAG